jgi:glucokinase
MSTDIVAIDVGGTTLKGARYGLDGLLAVATAPTPRTDVVRAIVELSTRLRSGQTGAVGVVVPGLVDEATGTVRYAANLNWRDVPLRHALASALELPIALGHDVAEAARAEAAASGSSDLLFVALGTGIGAAHVVAGMPRRGAAGYAGELGHLIVRPDGEACGCGRQGCLEAYASATAVARRYAAAGGRTGLDARAVVACAVQDQAAGAVWRDATHCLGEALAAATLLVDPGEIVLGGGLADAGDALLAPVRAALAAALPWRPPPDVRAGLLGSRAGLRGAAELAWRTVGAKVTLDEGCPA